MSRSDEVKTCEVCGLTQPIERFGKLKSSTPERMCLDCRKAQKNKQRLGLRGYLSALISSAKGNAQKRKTVFSFTVDEALGMWDKQQGRCAISNVFMTFHRDGEGLHDFNVSLDRVLPGGPYTAQNIRLVCVRVNLMRQTLSDSDFFWWSKNIASHWEENRHASD
jgi:hypothetical protein